ncbi:MAG: acyl-CoA dehydrogenase family protein [Anaerolineae bacterium]|nr:acyl-CoA dehydrogenase family protein [Anaerolineae bacterium]
MSQISAMSKLIEKIDMEKVMTLAEQVDLDQLLTAVGSMSPQDLKKMMKMLNGQKQPKAAPPVNSDFYDIYDLLSDEEQATLTRIRHFMEHEVAPIVNDYWERGEFPFELLPKLSDVFREMLTNEPANPKWSRLMMGLATIELSRVDPSFCTFLGVHWGLTMTSIQMFGSEEQKAHWLPQMERFEKIGSWALTEPLVGSATAGGLGTTARREGDTWVLNGQKKWSGNATFADVNVIFARDLADNQVKAFLVEKDTPGYTVEKLKGKISKRIVENVLITLDEVRIAEANRLPGVNTFGDVAAQLAIARVAVAWEAVGLAMGAYEKTLEYANNRIQFGKPITGFQLVQNGLVKMLGNNTATLTMMVRLAQLMERDDTVSQERASLAKAYCTEKMRETVAIGRNLLGGNGILLEHDVARFFADAEAVYSYEGTYEMNTLIVGRAITGQSAFV